MLARTHKKFQRGQHSEIYLLTLSEQDKTKMELPLGMVSISSVYAADINQLKMRDFCNQFNLEQLVKKSTRGRRILNVFLTNNPHLWNQPTVFKGLVRSDHLAVMVTPRIQAKPERKHVYFRDVRQHRKIDMENKLKFFIGVKFLA